MTRGEVFQMVRDPKMRGVGRQARMGGVGASLVNWDGEKLGMEVSMTRVHCIFLG
jgi:hypothetical protein